MEQANLGTRELNNVLNKKSGLKGVCGPSDMRDIHEASVKGNDRAKPAIDMFTFHIKKYIGVYAAVPGSVDSLAFTAGIGENDDIIRAKT